jgi:hypothetical protein
MVGEASEEGEVKVSTRKTDYRGGHVIRPMCPYLSPMAQQLDPKVRSPSRLMMSRGRKFDTADIQHALHLHAPKSATIVLHQPI